MPQLRIQHLMLLVLYVAVALAMSLPAMHARGVGRPLLLSVTIPGVPLTLAGLSWLILRPGPQRDLVQISFLFIAHASVGLTPFVFLALSKSDSLFWFLNLALGLAWSFRSLLIARKWLTLKPCPHCRKKVLLDAQPGKEPVQHQELTHEEARKMAWLESQRLAYYSCDSCARVGELSAAEARQSCPHCGGINLRRLQRLDHGYQSPRFLPRGGFYWCLACGAGASSVFRASGSTRSARMMTSPTGAGISSVGSETGLIGR